MTFGFATLGDALSWLVALMLGAKLVATVALLIDRRRERRVLARWDASLWWLTKIVPLPAVLIVLWLAYEAGDASQVRLYSALLVFVLIAVPIKIHRRWRLPQHSLAATGAPCSSTR